MSAVRMFALVFAAAVLAGCNNKDEPTYQGWIEADMVFVSPDEAGRIDTLSVREGDSAAAGAQLFTLDDDLQKADLRQIEATFTNAKQAFERAEQLLKTKAGTQTAYDNAQAALREADAKLNWAKTRLARRRMVSPVAGVVQQVYFRPGEMAPAGRPVIALLPPENIKVRFFVPESVLPKLAVGDGVRIRCDGCEANLDARVSFISRTAEYTPPVIYSLEERSKLVFLVEARPAQPDKLRVGQPVSVALGSEPKR